jgi:hypothetical protein
MKKFIAGVIVGALISAALPAYGAVTSLVGQKVAGQKEVQLNGKSVGTAIIVNNKSYLPVRDTANAFGASVTPSSEVISMTSNVSNETIEFELQTLQTNKVYYEKKVIEIQTTITNLEEVVIPQAIERMEARTIESEKEVFNQRVNGFKQDLESYKQQLSDYQAKLDQINARIAELESK